MKIGQKLIGSFSVVALICAIIGGVGWWGISGLDERMNEIGSVRLPAVQALGTMDAVMGDVGIAQMELLNPNMNVEDAQGLYADINEAFATIEGAADDFQSLIVDAEDERIFGELVSELCLCAGE